MDVQSLLLLLTSILCFLVFALKLKWRHKKLNLPPQAPGHPIIGNLLSAVPKSFQELVDIRVSLGDIHRVVFGPVSFTYLNTQRAIHEAFINQSDIFSGRQKLEFMTLLIHDAGIVNSDGPVWVEHRRLIMRLLKDFGVGRPLVNDIISEEASFLIQAIDKRLGIPFVSHELFSKPTSNVIARLIFGERSGTEDEQFLQFNSHLTKAFEIKTANFIAMIFPFIVRYSFFRRIFDRFSQTFLHVEFIEEYIKRKIGEQQEILQSMSSPPSELQQASNICEALLIEKSIQERENPGKHTFTELQMTMDMVDLFVAGTETTSTTLCWGTLLLASNLDIQVRVQKEIEDNIGRQRTPTMADRSKVPYVCAVLDEVMRYSSIATTAIHRATQDTKLLGYDIPNNTLIQANFYGAHHDPYVWECPNDFYPKHFLTSEGEYRPSKHLIPFSLGKRACLGESLARTEYFILFVSVMQNFRVELADPDIDIRDVLEGNINVIRHPKPHQVVFSRIDSTFMSY